MGKILTAMNDTTVMVDWGGRPSEGSGYESMNGSDSDDDKFLNQRTGYNQRVVCVS